MDVENVRLNPNEKFTITVKGLAEHIFSVIKRAKREPRWYRNYPIVLRNLLLDLCRDSEQRFSEEQVDRLSLRFDEAIALLKELHLIVDVTTPYTDTPTVRLSSLGEKSNGQEIRSQQKSVSGDIDTPFGNEQNSQSQKGEGIKVFISHRWAEGEHEFANELRKKLMNYKDITPLLDEYEMLPGDSIRDWMDDAIQKGCDVFLFLMSPGSLSSKNCLHELDLAIKTGLPIIPILIRDCEVPDSLRDILFADFREDPSLPFHLVDRLVKGIKRQAGKPQYKQANRAMEEEVINLLEKINPLIVKGLDEDKRISVVANSEDFADLTRLSGSCGILRIEPSSNTIIGHQAGKNLGIYTVRDNYGAKTHFYLSLSRQKKSSNGDLARAIAELIEEESGMDEETTPPKTAAPKLEDMHTQLQNFIPDELAQKYMSAEQQTTGENRPITALFADISGFTPLSNAQSSETMFRLVQGCFRELVDIVAIYEGSINGFRGDGLLALFGAPILHENDAERAIRAAMDMRSSMLEQGLEVSIGINTAIMTVGEIQTQLHSEYTAYGTDINLAKRLQEAAEPGQIMVGTGTHRLTRRIFDFETSSGLSVKGFQEPVTAYIVQQVKAHPEKLRGIEGLRARMIGREHEFADLKDAADVWRKRQGQMVNIIGEAGIGKSRLVSELKEYLANKDDEEQVISILEGRCISIGQPISYWPFLDILRAYFSLSEEDDEPDRARKVTETITQLMPQGADEVLPLLGNLLSIKFGNELDDRLKFASPEQIRSQTLMRLRDLFKALAEKQPLLLILEDLHWADDLSLDLISLLMDELANASLMLLCVYRPQKEHRVWRLGDQARRKCLDRYAELALHPLSSYQSRLLVESLLEIKRLPDSVRDAILAKSEGNPFFIEEVIRSLIEQDVVYREDEHWRARDEIADIHVPDTIQSVVLSRVDRLQPEAKYVLQRASVIGRLFRHHLLQHISSQERDLDRHIAEFEDKELIYEERTVPELEYAFKHSFTQEAIYEGIFEQRRREFHYQVAIGIEKIYQERLDEYYGELAHHYSRSEDAEKAVEYALKAGEKAKRNYENKVAILYFQQTLDMLEQRGIERNNRKLEALGGLGEVYLRVGKNSEAESMFRKAIVLAEKVDLSSLELVRLYYWLAEALHSRGQYDEEIQNAKMGLDILGSNTNCLEAVLMNGRIAAGNKWAGNPGDYCKYIRKNMALIRELPYSLELRSTYTGVIFFLHSVSELYSQEKNDIQAALKWATELERRAEECGDKKGLATAWGIQGDIHGNRGDYTNALAFYRKSLKEYKSIGDVNPVRDAWGTISDLLLRSGYIDGAEEHALTYLDKSEQLGSPVYIAHAYYLLGCIWMCRHGWEKALLNFQKFDRAYKASRDALFLSRHRRIGLTYLKKGELHRSLQYFKEASGEEIQDLGTLTGTLGGLEEAYMALGISEEFAIFCCSFREKHVEALREFPLYQWYLEPAIPSSDFSYLAFSDSFDSIIEATISHKQDSADCSRTPKSEKLCQTWCWIDPIGDCGYGIDDAEGVEIHAANGRGLNVKNMSAPRLMRESHGDFVMEVCIEPIPNEKPQMGGLLVFQDANNFLRFEKGAHQQYEMLLHGYVDGRWQIAGRGLLPVNWRDGRIYLRLERMGQEFLAYCSVDGVNFLTCGKMAMPMDESVDVGIHSLGMIDRAHYCGSFRDGTATVFRNFRIWTRG